MAIIVKYATDQTARNNFPYEIVSPPYPSRCCLNRMKRMGALQQEEERQFYYRRCETCGFTVREFLSTFDMARGVSLAVQAADPTWRWMERIRRNARAEYAA
ncbi:MAG: hypothetical protein HYY11_09410 [Candidatus Methylomirabilis oxyfera]|nr:hypothetical protein [Candidatus Methylomirabilis oxyfera]